MPHDHPTTAVLFICLGNICRSPMAEAIFRKLVTDAGLADQVEIDSAGTGEWHVGSPPHHGTQAILRKNGVSFDGQRARQIQPVDLGHYDYLIVMDSSNLDDVQAAGTAAMAQAGIPRPSSASWITRTHPSPGGNAMCRTRTIRTISTMSMNWSPPGAKDS